MTARWPLAAALLVVLVVLPGVTLGLAVVATLGGAVAGGGCGGDGGIGGGSQQIGGRVWSAEQTANAHTLVAGAAAAGLPKRAAVIAVSAAIVESGLHNRGDRGLLAPAGTDNQQRPSPGSGAPPRAACSTRPRPPTRSTPRWPASPTGPPFRRARPPPPCRRPTTPSGMPPTRPRPPRWWTASGGDRTCPRRRRRPVPPRRSPAASWPACWSLRRARTPAASDAPGPTGPLDRSRLPGEVGLPTDPARRAAVRFALAQVGRPYVFGAKGPRAFDCSGLTQAAWAAAGVGISAGTLAADPRRHPGGQPRRPRPRGSAVSPGLAGHPEPAAARRALRRRRRGGRGRQPAHRGDRLTAGAVDGHDRGDPPHHRTPPATPAGAPAPAPSPPPRSALAAAVGAGR